MVYKLKQGIQTLNNLLIYITPTLIILLSLFRNKLVENGSDFE